MSFYANAGRIRVTDANGVEKLDTDDGLFHVVGNPINGSRDIAAVTASNGTAVSARNRIDTQNIGMCHAACTHIIGAVRFSGAGQWGVGFSRWTSYMGGDLVWACTAPGLTSGTQGQIQGNITTWVSYRFFCAAGVVKLERRMFLPEPPGSVSLTIKAHTIEFKLKAGLFS